ncbi:hypothetical protein RD792_012537 [Penstemon davidsonii]|uniref:Glycosyltransferase n=1 Tax=Penstemon davidsonii TaxID=160366 RepID=A0ABR0CX55_9LAMI|nr:hypothetical protein RD792_012537 [Penstemon davidsonii]
MAFQLHIGVLAFPFGTHAAPLLTLVRRLAASAPATKFSFFNSATSNSTLVFPVGESNSCGNIQAYDVWDGTPEGFSGTHFEEVGLFLKASPGNFEKVIEEAEEESGLKISCLISDAFLWFACDLAEKRGVPWVAFWTAASCSLSAHTYTDAIQNAVGSKGSEEIANQTVSFIPGLSTLQFNDLPPEIFPNKDPTPLALTIYNMVQKLPKSTAVVLNSFEEIDPIITKDLKSKFQHFLNIGPSILTFPTPDDKNECLSWLKNQTNPRSVIYISFGTLISPPPNEIAALAGTLEELKLPFLWSIKDHAKKFLPEGFSERISEFGKIVSWAPQLQLLQQSCVGVFITHCGWNSVLESVTSGVPMICRPFFGDQKVNGKMVESSWKIGVRVNGGVFTKSGIIEALNHILLSDDGREITENVYKLREKAVDAVKLEGSSTKNFNKLLELISASN